MEISIRVGMLKVFLKKHPNEDIEEGYRYYDDTRVQNVEIDGMSEEELDTLIELAGDSDDKVAFNIIRKIRTFRKLKENPAGEKVGRLENLEQALKNYLSTATNHWLFVEEDGFLLPCYVNHIEYQPYDAHNESPAHCVLRMIYLKRGDKKGESATWYKSDLVGGKLVNDLLMAEKYYVPNDDLMKAYEASMGRYKEHQPRTGEQFIAQGEGDLISEERYSRQRTSMVQDGVADKLVMDDIHEEGAEFGGDALFVSDTFWNKGKEDAEKVMLPVHPYLKLFDLDRHSFVTLHVDQLQGYKWNPALGDKLILPAAHKEVIQILMDTASEEIDDIIAGKSGGTICICTGEPGTGKTLTAEVTSEVIKRPLYKVNCSQLGTDEEAIEKELSNVLQRATRWKCLLLIDEADVYVRARDNDIQQNAIVGVFLRVLEYYRGVLFLTSNRATVIDDAIMSRATVHLKYEKPTRAALGDIWQVLSKQFGMEMSAAFIAELVKTFPDIVGRDVKNLLKLVIRYQRRIKGKLDVELFKKMAVHKDIAFIGDGRK